MERRDVSLAQLWTTALAPFLVQAFQTMPRNFALRTATAAPWAILAVSLAAFVLFWPVAAALARRPGQNLVHLALAAGGRPLAMITALVVGVALIGTTGINLRMTSEMTTTSLYPHTPQTFVMVSMVGVAVVAAAISPPAIMWLTTLFTWPALISILLVLVGNVAWGQLANVRPVAGPGLWPVAREALPLTSYYGELITLAVFSSYLASPRQLVSATANTIAAAGLTWSAVTLVYLMVFPLPGGLDVPFPLQEMTRLVQGGRFFERLDAVLIAFWAFGTAGRTATSLMVAALLFRDAFRLASHRAALLPLAVAMVAVALIPTSQADTIDIQANLVRYWGFVPVLVWPLLVALVARWREGTASA